MADCEFLKVVPCVEFECQALHCNHEALVTQLGDGYNQIKTRSNVSRSTVAAPRHRLQVILFPRAFLHLPQTSFKSKPDQMFRDRRRRPQGADYRSFCSHAHFSISLKPPSKSKPDQMFRDRRRRPQGADYRSFCSHAHFSISLKPPSKSKPDQMFRDRRRRPQGADYRSFCSYAHFSIPLKPPSKSKPDQNPIKNLCPIG